MGNECCMTDYYVTISYVMLFRDCSHSMCHVTNFSVKVVNVTVSYITVVTASLSHIRYLHTWLELRGLSQNKQDIP